MDALLIVAGIVAFLLIVHRIRVAVAASEITNIAREALRAAGVPSGLASDATPAERTAAALAIMLALTVNEHGLSERRRLRLLQAALLLDEAVVRDSPYGMQLPDHRTPS